MDKRYLIIAFIFLIFLPLALSEVTMKCKYDKKANTYDCVFNKFDVSVDVGMVKGGIHVYGTDYYPGESGRVYVQLLDENSVPIDDAVCLFDMYSPDNEKLFDDASMFFLENGLYYFDLLIPEEEGVYMVAVRCMYLIEKTYDYTDSVTIVHGGVSGTVEDTWKDDDEYHTVNERLISGGGYSFDFYYDFYNVSIPNNVTGMAIYWIGRWTSDEEYVYIYLYDWCNSSWILLPNRISTNTPTVSNFLSVDNYDMSCLMTPDGMVRVRFTDEDWSEKTKSGDFMTDYIVVEMDYAVFGQINSIRGGGEVHIHTPRMTSDGISTEVWKRYLELYPYIKEVQQQVDPQICVDNETLMIYTNYTFCIGDECSNVTYKTYQHCEYGCDPTLNRCIPSSFQRYGIFALLVLAMMLISGIAWKWFA